MFDKLVESSKQKQGGRARRLFLATSLIYAVALFAFGVMAIMGFSPALAGEYSLITLASPASTAWRFGIPTETTNHQSSAKSRTLWTWKKS